MMMMVVVMFVIVIVMMFVIVIHGVVFLIGMNASQKQIDSEIGEQYAQEGDDSVNVEKHRFLE